MHRSKYLSSNGMIFFVGIYLKVERQIFVLQRLVVQVEKVSMIMVNQLSILFFFKLVL